MPKTWSEVAKAMGFEGTELVLQESFAIPAAANYMAQIRNYKLWRSERDPNLHKISQAAYNAGMGNIARAIKKADSKRWDNIASELPNVTGRHAKETQTYVKKIWQYFEELMNDPMNSTDSHRRSLVLSDLMGLR
jgi:hypothetical protein